MSYILDALRRAENERERERQGLPGLNSQLHEQGPALDTADDGGPIDGGQGRIWYRMAGGLVLGLSLGGLVWWAVLRLGTAPPSDNVVLAPSVPALPQALPPPEAAAAVPAPPLPAPSPPAASAPVLVPLPAVLPDPPKKTVPPAKPERKVAPQPTVKAEALGSSESTQPEPPASTQTAGQSRAIRSLGQLPDSMRRELPPLAVSGSMYSPQPAARMLVLDGQVVREGDELRPGLSIETIGSKSAILNYRGERFRLTF